MEAHMFEATTTQFIVRWVGLEWDVFSIGPLYLTSMSFGADQIENINKTHI